MVMFGRGQLIQYKNYNGVTAPDEEAGRILDPIIDTTNTFTGAYLVCFLPSLDLEIHTLSALENLQIGST